MVTSMAYMVPLAGTIWAAGGTGCRVSTGYAAVPSPAATSTLVPKATASSVATTVELVGVLWVDCWAVEPEFPQPAAISATVTMPSTAPKARIPHIRGMLARARQVTGDGRLGIPRLPPSDV